ncbi:MFS transporter [Kocuria marina]|uniref:MFS transporter n=1 Tax=Kocuria marina TaxID=223184 RepID=UPI002989D16A|nr:MFS transporter [Kocuria marina]MCT1734851.1 MFS transporter [Kocuria marina]
MIQFVDVLGVTSVITAAPQIISALGGGAGVVSAITTVYAVFFGGLLVLGSRLGERWGHKHVLTVGLLGLAAAGALGAVATGSMMVLAARALQGVAAAVSVPSAMTLLLAVADQAKARDQALGLWSTAGALAGVTGYVVGGGLTAAWGWPAVFWINIPVALVLLTLLLVTVPAGLTDRTPHRSLDLPGALLLLTTVVLVVIGTTLIQDDGTRVLGILLILGAVPVAVTARSHWRRTQAALIPLSALRDAKLRTGVLASAVNTATTSSTGVLVSTHLQTTAGSTALQASLSLMPFSIGVIIGSTLAPRLIRARSRATVLILGTALCGVANATTAAVLVPGWGLRGALLAVGVGLGLASVAATGIGTDVEEQRIPVATGLLNTSAQLGTALGVAATMATASMVGSTTAGLLLAGVVALLAAVAYRYWPQPSRRVHA